MKFTRTALSIILFVVLLVVGGVWYLKTYLKQTHPVNAPPVTQKEVSPLDLRPAAIAKLQQLVEAGSDSLYQLRIDSLLTDITTGTLILKGVAIRPDSVVIQSMQAQKRLPDDVYHISLSSLRITGIGLSDILHRRDLSLQSIVCTHPQITVYHRRQSYNAGKRATAKDQTLFSRLQGQIDRLAIDSVSITGGSLTDNSDGTTRTYQNVSVALREILIDSTTEQDPSRFLFAKRSLLQAGKITLPAGKSRYDISIGGIAVSGEKQQLHIQNLTLKPQGGKAGFLRHQKHRIEVFDLAVPALTLNGVDWWAAAHGESLLAQEAEITGVNGYIYFDRRLPKSGSVKKANFPQQLLADLKMPLSIKRVRIKKSNLAYEEFAPESGSSGRITFNNINAVAQGFTNLPAEIASRPTARFEATCRFMNATDLSVQMEFALPSRKRGAFKVDLAVGRITPAMVNSFAEPMGLVRITSGQAQYAKAHIEGNNSALQGTLAAAYTDLHIMPLKAADHPKEGLKSKRITGTLANMLFVKDNNPSRGNNLRQPSFELNRSADGSSFFNFVWSGIRLGLFKTIGLPARLTE
ncbi:MAG: hypothetical protein EOP52_06625 [Sphingobacteriales bacterium]|nr:MAG: hypothetical protein EOP52_06625 [Sphingobacteriales bacterium]